MKTIAKEFKGRGEVRGIIFTLLKRDGLLTLWGRSDNTYEVVNLVERKETHTTFGGKEVVFEAKELYPQGESWSLQGHGKAFMTYERAEQNFKERQDEAKHKVRKAI